MLRKNRKTCSFISLALMLLFFYGPIIVLMIFSFNDSKSLTAWNGFSTQWYGKLLQSRDVMASVRVSVLIAFIATAVSMVWNYVLYSKLVFVEANENNRPEV